MKRNLTKVQKRIISIAIVIAFVLLLAYFAIRISISIGEDKFIKQAIEISDANESPVFKIQKVLAYSSANAIDNTEEHSLKDLDISQYSDLAIYIDNKSYINDLTPENTVKSLRIDNIEIMSDQPTGMKSLTYKSPLNFGRFEITEAAQNYNSTDTYIQCAPIDYQIIQGNTEQPDYNTPVFHTDCSNAIALGYLNKNVVSHFSLPDNNNISFNGTLLNQAKVNLPTLNTNINFRINITNNLDQQFSYNVKLNLSFSSDSKMVTNGYTFVGREFSTDSTANNFFKDI